MTQQAWRNFVCSICNRKRPPSEKRESGWGRAGQITLPVCNALHYLESKHGPLPYEIHWKGGG